jgi:glycosyltransferase involved in cell wall biosynthesis
MRIAQIVASLEARHGGPSRSVLGLAHGLARLGHDVELLTTEPDVGRTDQPAPHLFVRRFPRRWPQAFAAAPDLARHLNRERYDVIHNHGLWLRPLHYAAQAARRSGSPLVISPRGMMTDWAWRYRRSRKYVAGRLVHPGALHDCAGWHATSTEEATDIGNRGFDQPVAISPNGIDLPSEQGLAEARRHWLEACPEIAQRRVALFYSRFHPKKRILELIELWAAHAPAEWLLLLVGIPEAYTIADLDRYVIRCNAAGRVVVHDGTDAPAPYPVASLFLLPSHSENFGLTIAEALAHGLPVLTTDGTPWRGLAAHGAGQCVPWTDYTAVMKGMLACPPEALAASGKAGRAWMEAEFTWEKSAAVLVAFYERLRGSPR